MPIPNFPLLETMSPFYVGAKSADILHDMLLRGFTTVHDAGGADLLLLNANPLDDIHVLTKPQTHLEVVMKGGLIYQRHHCPEGITAPPLSTRCLIPSQNVVHVETL